MPLYTSQQHTHAHPDDDLLLLSSYLDGELPPAEADEVSRRFADDPSLQHTLDELRHTVHLLHELSPPPLPRSFALDPATAPAQSWWQRLWGAGKGRAWMPVGGAFAATAAVLLMVVVATGVVDVGPEDTVMQSAQLAPTSALPTPAPAAAPMAVEEEASGPAAVRALEAMPQEIEEEMAKSSLPLSLETRHQPSAVTRSLAMQNDAADMANEGGEDGQLPWISSSEQPSAGYGLTADVAESLSPPAPQPAPAGSSSNAPEPAAVPLQPPHDSDPSPLSPPLIISGALLIALLFVTAAWAAMRRTRG